MAGYKSVVVQELFLESEPDQERAKFDHTMGISYHLEIKFQLQEGETGKIIR